MKNFLLGYLFAYFIRGLTFDFENGARVVEGFKRLTKAMEDDNESKENEEKVVVEARVMGFKG